MPRPASTFNDGHPRNYTAIEPKGAYAPKDSWWVQPTRNDFIVRRDAELPRLMRAATINPTAESGRTARESYMARKVVGMLNRVRGGAE